jgi:3-dehydroquinate dehydratase/shikimate dehydrogenase
MSIQIVETVTGQSMSDLRAARDRASGDLVELRLDSVPRPDVQGALEGRRTPVIVTCRPTWEGGGFEGPEEARLRLLGDAIRLGAEYVDVEWRADRDRLPTHERTRLVISHHDFTGVPVDLGDRVRSMLGAGADIVKVAITPGRLSDCMTLRDAMRFDQPHVAIAMGRRGELTRLCPWLFGSCWTYGGAAAAGQPSTADLREVYRVSERSASTAIYGIAGSPLAHSASPAMHNPAFQACGIDAIYVPFETTDADDLLAVADVVGARGFSVTAPLKERTFARVPEVDDLSRRIGAVNTLRREASGAWAGRNFDVAGFLSPFDRRGIDLAGTRAVVLGAGGAARTAIWALTSRGARVVVSARREDRAVALAAEFGIATVAWPPQGGRDLLVNATPVGTWPHVAECPVPISALGGGCVYDLIYNPADTALLVGARAAGADAIGGLEMLIGQACRQFEWWTGQAAPAAEVAAAAAAFVQRTHGVGTPGVSMPGILQTRVQDPI